jgi:hypothetical protein
MNREQRYNQLIDQLLSCFKYNIKSWAGNTIHLNLNFREESIHLIKEFYEKEGYSDNYTNELIKKIKESKHESI